MYSKNSGNFQCNKRLKFSDTNDEVDEDSCDNVWDDVSDNDVSDDNEVNIILDDFEETNEFSTWKRPRLTKQNFESSSLIFQQMDIDYYICNRLNKPVFRIYGVNNSGNSIVAHVHGYYPYFYVKPPPDFKSENCDDFQKILNEVLREKSKKRKDIEHFVVKIELCLLKNIYGFSQNQEIPYIRITVLLPSLISSCKKILEEGLLMKPYEFQNLWSFESDIDFTLKFMVDSGFVGCTWVEFPAKSFKVRSNNQKTSHCQLEVDIDFNKVIYHPAEKEWSKIAPIRIISLNVLCTSRTGNCPDTERDSVIQISNIVIRFGDPEPFIKNIFTLNTCTAVVGVKIFTHSTEQELLLHWSKFIREIDPDIIIGYNTQNFDLPYLINRASKLNIRNFNLLGRIRSIPSIIKVSCIQSKQLGRRNNKNVHMAGRVQFDLLQILYREHKLRSYSLNAISLHFFEEQTEVFSYQVITDLHNGTDLTRRRLAVYNLKDSNLVFRLINKLMVIVNSVEMARVAGVPLSCLLSRGQQIKVLSLILRKAKAHGFILPEYRVKNIEEYSGGKIIEPEKGYYTKPIVVLDFASLYPSIMIANNLCYTTFLTSESMVEKFDLADSDYIETPSGSYFVKSSVQEGLLPKILSDLLEARKRTKQEMARETDVFIKQVLDGRQLAIKLIANSVYGFTGAQIGKLPCLAIASSVTAFGREMISKTKQLIEHEYTLTNGYTYNAKVIYGDTDSVMCLFGVETVAEAIDFGRKSADFISQHFVAPVKMEFENVYLPYLLIAKKRYAGMYYTKPQSFDKMNCKGIETVRRDSCPLVGNLLNSCLKQLLINCDKESALEQAQSVISDLLCNRVDIAQLIISKELTKTDVEYTSKQPHSEVAIKMRNRDPGSAPKLGDRVPYLITNAGVKNKTHTKAEDPMCVLEKDMSIDTDYYLKNQLLNPLLRIFEPVFGKEFTTEKLLHGKHMMSKSRPQSNFGALTKFTFIKPKCVGCKNILKENEKSLCEHCYTNAPQIYHKEVLHMRTLEGGFSRLWTECQRCSESLHEEVLCTNRDCPIFYMRKAVQKKLIAQNEIIEKLDRDLSW